MCCCYVTVNFQRNNTVERSTWFCCHGSCKLNERESKQAPSQGNLSWEVFQPMRLYMCVCLCITETVKISSVESLGTTEASVDYKSSSQIIWMGLLI